MSFAEPGLEIVPGLTLLEPLGRGGMGEVWLARDAERGERVVAKVLPPGASDDSVALLRREARLGKKLSHPRIVPVYAFHTGERGSAVTLRFMRGGEARWRGGVPPPEAVRITRDVAEALEYLHGLGVVHRDVKASNVLLDDVGRAHLADFGIAALPPGEEEGMVLCGGGSRASMSPQHRAGEPARPADDLYALGAFLFELLSGHPPFPTAARDEAGRVDAPRVTSSFPMPDSLVTLVAALLARSPLVRPVSARAVIEALDAIEPDCASTPGPALRPRAVPPPVRLQPPPRVAGGGSAARESLSFAQISLLAGLGIAAVAAVAWLPRWAETSAAPPKAVQTPAPVPAQTPGLQPSPLVEPTPAAVGPTRAEIPPRVAPASRREGPPSSSPAPPSVLTPPAESTPDREAEARSLALHRDAARDFEAREDWNAALREYDAALAVDPFVAFAIEGRARSGSMAALQAALDFHLGNPARLSTEVVAREAEALLERARGMGPAGPRQQARMADLERALADARTTVTVQLESDGKTDLTVSRVGRLGTLTRRPLQLRPGTYTVVGSRPGYRDVRRQFTVAPRSPAQTVVVRCEEAI